uniref:hypothetical protein n=1 Tax=Psychrobacter sp. DAB_AL43B TaxID=1028416 RepID=UPI0002571917|nr:hypothetical protein [Psychrobacter sp. DAB_AL43B]AFF18202.1 hypothetical protein [Psychrobacter sp. DAB_AL43B]
MEVELMKQFLFDKLKVGTAVIYAGQGLKVHDFRYFICQINKDSKTVDIEKYSEATGKPDSSSPIKENISLDDIEFFHTKDKTFAQLSANALRL